LNCTFIWSLLWCYCW